MNEDLKSCRVSQPHNTNRATHLPARSDRTGDRIIWPQNQLICQKTSPCGEIPTGACGDQVVLQSRYGTSSCPQSDLSRKAQRARAGNVFPCRRAGGEQPIFGESATQTIIPRESKIRGELLVEAVGIEPTSEELRSPVSPCAAGD